MHLIPAFSKPSPTKKGSPSFGEDLEKSFHNIEMLENTKETTKRSILKKDWRKLIYQKWIVKNVPFFLFMAALTVMYIANGHYADKTIIKINMLDRHLKEMEYEFKTIKRDLIFRSKESELVKAVEPIGLKELLIPPMKISDSTVNK